MSEIRAKKSKRHDRISENLQTKKLRDPSSIAIFINIGIVWCKLFTALEPHPWEIIEGHSFLTLKEEIYAEYKHDFKKRRVFTYGMLTLTHEGQILIDESKILAGDFPKYSISNPIIIEWKGGNRGKPTHSEGRVSKKDQE